VSKSPGYSNLINQLWQVFY